MNPYSRRICLLASFQKALMGTIDTWADGAGVNARQAVQVARMARRFAGCDPDLSTVTAALHRSAGSVGATLTPGCVAIEPAGDAATRLDAYIEAMRGSGVLKQLNITNHRSRCGSRFR
jgi:hypothetical protein